MYSPKDIQKLLNVSPSTLARYGNVFTGFLSQGATRPGKKRSYTEGDYYTLVQIRDLYRKNTPTEEIKKILAGGGASITTRAPMPLIPAGLTDAFGKIDDKLGDHDQRIDKHDQRIDQIEDFQSNWVNEWNAFNAKSWLTRVWLTVTGRAPAKPPGV